MVLKNGGKKVLNLRSSDDGFGPGLPYTQMEKGDVADAINTSVISP